MKLRVFTAGLLAISLSACSALPQAGPSAGELKADEIVEHVLVTPALAEEMAIAARAAEKEADDRGVSELINIGYSPPRFQFSPGDVLSVTLFSFPAATGGSVTAATALEPNELGEVVVDRDGAIQLPYVGNIQIAGLDLDAAQNALSRSFRRLGLFRIPSVAVTLESSPSNGILITGAVGAPRRVPWIPGGRTLADALTEVLGENSTLLREEDDAAARAATEVDVIRGGQAPVTLPMSRALAEQVPLLPGDRVVVRRESGIRVAMLGAGIRESGQLSFAAPPQLTDALARASGLDNFIADGHAVFVLRRREGMRPTLYDFPWRRSTGLLAAHSFRLADNDLVYVAEAPIVSLQVVTNTLFPYVLMFQAVR